jgi:hypothetical protein
MSEPLKENAGFASVLEFTFNASEWTPKPEDLIPPDYPPVRREGEPPPPPELLQARTRWVEVICRHTVSAGCYGRRRFAPSQGLGEATVTCAGGAAPAACRVSTFDIRSPHTLGMWLGETGPIRYVPWETITEIAFHQRAAPSANGAATDGGPARGET